MEDINDYYIHASEWNAPMTLIRQTTLMFERQERIFYEDINDLCLAEQFETFYLLLRQGNSDQNTPHHLNSYKHIRTWNSRKNLRLRECSREDINEFMHWQKRIY